MIGQLSVATSSAAEDLFVESELTETLRTDIEKWIDESKLSVMNVPCAKTNELEKSLSVESRNSSLDVSLTQIDFDDKISEYTRSHSAGDNLERLTISDDSSEKSFSYVEDDKNCQVNTPTVKPAYNVLITWIYPIFLRVRYDRVLLYSIKIQHKIATRFFRTFQLGDF